MVLHRAPHHAVRADSVACFIAVGVILFDALTDEIYAENDLSIVLACRHLRRLATEMQDVNEVPRAPGPLDQPRSRRRGTGSWRCGPPPVRS